MYKWFSKEDYDRLKSSDKPTQKEWDSIAERVKGLTTVPEVRFELTEERDLWIFTQWMIGWRNNSVRRKNQRFTVGTGSFNQNKRNGL